MLLPCDFCNSKMAVLFCGADSAKLCLLCDRHVHSANAVSLNHVRFKLCDTCKNQTAAVRCSTDNLMLCEHCDWDIHSHNNSSSPSLLHQRTTIQGFSGCPSIVDLASLLGLDFKPSSLVNMDFQGHPVPNCGSSVSSTLCKAEILRNEKNEDEVCEQIVEMGRRNLGEEDEDEGDLGVGTPSSVEVDNKKDDVWVQQQTPFSSMLMLADDTDVSKNDDGGEGDLAWDSNPTYRAAQEQWDDELWKQVIKKEEGRGISWESKKVTESVTKVREKKHVGSGRENGRSCMVLNSSLEEVAKKRGDAMLRYREKKKTRRYDKQIRYESRKATADMRKRVRGRFVKATHTADAPA